MANLNPTLEDLVHFKVAPMAFHDPSCSRTILDRIKQGTIFCSWYGVPHHTGIYSIHGLTMLLCTTSFASAEHFATILFLCRHEPVVVLVLSSRLNFERRSSLTPRPRPSHSIFETELETEPLNKLVSRGQTDFSRGGLV